MGWFDRREVNLEPSNQKSRHLDIGTVSLDRETEVPLLPLGVPSAFPRRPDKVVPCIWAARRERLRQPCSRCRVLSELPSDGCCAPGEPSLSQATVHPATQPLSG